MRTIRALFRSTAFLAMTIPLYACYRLTGRRAIVRSWARASARIIGLRTRVSGSIPAGGFVVANH
ncbi:MAG TPA: 1-acyl-sn-glycerol-3-phosphate acyltransferase, partial [Thermoanaerobaculia bacterium]|nr:1-acyl-sn-glycerol-3-phosphate acyltransferase [Thermoanaerobaculia bacterium]